MPPDYPLSALTQDVITIMQDNMPTVIAVAVLVAGVNFVVGWFMHALFSLSKAYKG